ncbi:MAG TPA: hypothetical protein VHO03_12750 [Ignavibacteriales bacterium]|nr:hypothetical protein [Ignavibacteriales bacterium]
MSLITVIVYLSHIIWSLPPFRQYKGKFFNYFFIFAIGDPIAAFLIRLGCKNTHPLNATIAAAALISVMALNKSLSKTSAISFVLVILAAGIIMPYEEVRLMTASIFMVLIYYFIRYMIFFTGKYGRVSLFHILFLIYNISLALKLINVALDLQKGRVFFYFTTAFEIILGILFCIFREDDKRFSFKLSRNLSYDS